MVGLRCRERRVGTEVAPPGPIPVSRDHGLQQLAPALGRVDMAGTQAAPLQVAELVQNEQGVIAAAAESDPISLDTELA